MGLSNFARTLGVSEKFRVPDSLGVLIIRILLFRVSGTLFRGPYNRDPTI